MRLSFISPPPKPICASFGAIDFRELDHAQKAHLQISSEKNPKNDARMTLTVLHRCKKGGSPAVSG